jgi:hemolysin III
MGWIGVIAIVPIMSALPHVGLIWLIGGGIIYTLGVLFYILESVPFAHTIWHIFVIFGAVCQFICIYNYIIPNH